jgi:glycosyltransferase involved in cell wall biosynthesis
MVSGIPVVVSDRGGLPEVVGKTGEVVTNIDSVDAWKQAIEEALENHNPEAQKERVKRFSARNQGEKLSIIASEIAETDQICALSAD